MKTILKALSAVALTGVMVLPVLANDATTTTDAKDQKDLKKVIEDQGINYVETAQKGITLSGYVDVSYTEQFGGRGRRLWRWPGSSASIRREQQQFQRQRRQDRVGKGSPGQERMGGRFPHRRHRAVPMPSSSADTAFGGVR